MAKVGTIVGFLLCRGHGIGRVENWKVELFVARERKEREGRKGVRVG